MCGKFTPPGLGSDISFGRLNSDGTLNSTFATNGILNLSLSSFEDQVSGIALQVDGKILFTGHNGGQSFISRLNSDGSWDSTFGINGIQYARNYYFNTVDLINVAALAEGKVMVSGWTADRFLLLARFLSNGTPDSSFDSDGFEEDASIDGELMDDLKIDSQGRIELCGTACWEVSQQ